MRRLLDSASTTIVSFLTVLLLSACQPSTHTRLQARAPDGLQRYLDFDEGDAHYKVFVAGLEGGWAFRSRLSYEHAVSDALEACNPPGGGYYYCRLFAVGNEIVIDMSSAERERTIKAYKESRQTSASLLLPVESHVGTKCYALLKRYWALGDATSYKVFVFSEEGVCSYRSRSEFDQAYGEAMRGCADRVDSESIGRDCHVFAIGNQLVWKKSEAAVAKIKEDYAARKSLQQFDLDFGKE